MKPNIIETKLMNPLLNNIVNKLYEAGMNVYQISDVLNIKSSQALSYLGDRPPYPSHEPNMYLINEILCSEGLSSSALDTLIESERVRYSKYAMIETACLDAMMALMSYYRNLPLGEDLKRDRFLSELSNNFIKATQTARQELLKRYEIDRNLNTDSNTVKVEVDFV